MLLRPEHIPDEDFKNTVATVDTANSNSAVVSNGIVTVKTGIDGFYPVFACEQLITGQSCKIEVIDATQRRAFMVGVATADLRNRVDSYRSINSLCIFTIGTLISDSKLGQGNFELETGDRVMIRHHA